MVRQCQYDLKAHLSHIITSNYYIPTYLYMLNFPLPSGNIGQFFVLKKAQSCDYAKIPYYTGFGTASISLVGFAHTRSFQDGDQKHG